MKQARCFKKLTALLLTLVLMIGLAPSWGGISYANPTLNHAGSGFPLNTSETVKAKFTDGTEAILEISGHGQIERAKWIAMAQLIDSDNYSHPFIPFLAWKGSEPFNIKFTADIGKKIALPVDSLNLFASFDGDILFGSNQIDTSNVTNMGGMFFNAKTFNQPLDFDTSSVTNMSAMFDSAVTFNQSINFDTSNVTDMSSMFYGATNYTQPIVLNISSLKDNPETPWSEGLGDAFAGCQTSSITLNNTTGNKDIFALETFTYTPKLSYLEFSGLVGADIQKFNTNYTVNDKTANLQGHYPGSTGFIFENNHAYVIEAYTGTLPATGIDTISDYPLNQAGTVKATYNSGANTLDILGDGPIERARWTTMTKQIDSVNNSTAYSVLWRGSETFVISFKADTGKKIALPADSSDLFSGFDKDIIFGSNQIDTSNVTDMDTMFVHAVAFNQPLDFDTGNVTNMRGMFLNAKAFNQPLDFDTSNVTDMEAMFYGTVAFNQSLNFDTGNVTNMSRMFKKTAAFNQAVNFNTSNVTDMSEMFFGAKAFNQPVNFDTSSVTNMEDMFFGTSSYTQPIVLDISSIKDNPDTFPTESLENAFDGCQTSSIILLNLTGNTDIDAKRAFKDTPNLSYLEFSGLKNARIGRFAGNYMVEKNGTVSGPVSASTWTDFENNQVYRVYLEGAKPIGDCSFGNIAPQVYTGLPLTPEVEVKDASTVLTRDTDYTLLYSENTAAGTATVRVIGKGAYYGLKDGLTFEIKKQPLSGNTIALTHEAGTSGSFTVQATDYVQTGTVLKDFAVQSISDPAGILPATTSSAITVTTGGSITYTLSGAGSAGDSATVNFIDSYLSGQITMTITLTEPAGSGSGSSSGSGSGDSDDGWVTSGGGDNNDGDKPPVVINNQTGETTTPTEPTNPTEPTQPTIKQFSDVKPTDWFYDAVYDVVNKGLMKGTSETTFSPQLGTTRAMLVTILYRLAGEPQAGQTAAFSDLESGSWYVDAVAWAAQNGIVNGYQDGTFKPNQDLTREQLVTMLYRYAQFNGQDVSAKVDLSGYTDSASISPYALDAMQWAVAKGIIKGVGDNKLAPQGSATRAQIATMMSRFDK